MTDAWKLTLFNQFHDVLAGTSIKPAYEDARDDFGHACSLAEHTFNRAVQAIAARIDIPAEPEMTPIVVFNPHAWPVRENVEFEFDGFQSGSPRLVDDNGTAVPLQPTRSRATVTGARGRFVFPADLPPLGYRVYRIYVGGDESSPVVSATDSTLENDFLAVRVDAATGWLSRLEDKRSGVDLVAGRRGGHAVVIDDRSDTWGHRVKAYDDVIGELECTSARLVEQGPVRAVLRIESRYGRSTLAEELILSAGAPWLDVRVTLDWRERLRLLKLRAPTSLAADRATFEVPYGHLERAAGGDEEPAQTWVDVAAGGTGIAVLNDGKYGFDVRSGDIGITVARSPVYAWHEPAELDPDGVYDYLDQGRQDFSYRLLPHEGDWRAAGTVRLAAQLNQLPFALLESSHHGDLPQASSYAAIEGDDVALTVLKAAEDADGALVVRAYETAGRPARATIHLPLVERTIEADFGANELKTFKVPRDPAAAVAETSLLEW